MKSVNSDSKKRSDLSSEQEKLFDDMYNLSQKMAKDGTKLDSLKNDHKAYVDFYYQVYKPEMDRYTALFERASKLGFLKSPSLPTDTKLAMENVYKVNNETRLILEHDMVTIARNIGKPMPSSEYPIAAEKVKLENATEHNKKGYVIFKIFELSWYYQVLIYFGLGVVLILLIYELYCGIWNSIVRRELNIDIIKPQFNKSRDNSISVFNIFWDLGADLKAFRFLQDIGLTKRIKDINEDSLKNIKKIIINSGGYHRFISQMHTIIEQEAKGIYSRESQLDSSKTENTLSQIDKINNYYKKALKVKVDVPKESEIKGKLRLTAVHAIGQMFGVPLGSITAIAKGAEKIPNAAMVYYRVNDQNKRLSSSQKIFRTAEDLGSELSAGIAGSLVGFSLGSIIGHEMSLDLDGDASVDGWESVAVSLAFGLIGSVVTGKVFQGIAKWWKLRHFRKMKEDYDSSCELLAQYVLDENLSIFNKSLDKGIEFWDEKIIETVEIANTNEITNVEAYLLKETIKTEKRIIKYLLKERSIFVNSLNKLIRKGNISDAGRVIYAHRDYLLNGIKKVENYLKSVENKFADLVQEIKSAKAKGLLEK